MAGLLNQNIIQTRMPRFRGAFLFDNLYYPAISAGVSCDSFLVNLALIL